MFYQISEYGSHDFDSIDRSEFSTLRDFLRDHILRRGYELLPDGPQEDPLDTMASNLPVISIASYVSKTSTKEERWAVSKALHEACRDFGFFYLDATSFVSIEERDDLVRLAREFFALPQGQKDEISIANEDLARGVLLIPLIVWSTF